MEVVTSEWRANSEEYFPWGERGSSGRGEGVGIRG